MVGMDCDAAGVANSETDVCGGGPGVDVALGVTVGEGSGVLVGAGVGGVVLDAVGIGVALGTTVRVGWRTTVTSNWITPAADVGVREAEQPSKPPAQAWRNKTESVMNQRDRVITIQQAYDTIAQS